MIVIPFKDLTAEDTVGMALHFMWPLSRYFKDYIHIFLAHQSALHSTSLFTKRDAEQRLFYGPFKNKKKSLSTLKGSLAEDSNRPQNAVQKKPWKHKV